MFCPGCGARNDVDAPYVRELEASGPRVRHAPDGAATAPLPDFETFAARAEALAAPRLATSPGEPVMLVIEDGTPAVDDGGEPLLGSYVPPLPGDAQRAPSPATVTVYYRTFAAVWAEDGPYDWEDELDETIEHELLHHAYFLRGEDPMDDEERDVIAGEGLRLVGKREATRRAFGDFAADLREFFTRTWPLWILALFAAIVGLVGQR